jgi:hypothetical protein
VRTRLLSILPLFAIVLAACGGGGSKSSSTTSAPTTTASTASSNAGSDAAATARAQKLVFVQADFPPGWTAAPSAPDTPEDKATNEELDKCIGTSGQAARSADVKGDDFTMGQGTQVSSEAQIVKDESTYRSDVAAIKGSKLQPCLQDFLNKQITKAAGGAPGSLQLSSLTVPTFGDVTVGKRLTASITVQGQTLNVYVDFVLMGKNRAEVTASFSSVGQPFDATLQRSLLDKLGAKLKSA